MEATRMSEAQEVPNIQKVTVGITGFGVVGDDLSGYRVFLKLDPNHTIDLPESLAGRKMSALEYYKEPQEPNSSYSDSDIFLILDHSLESISTPNGQGVFDYVLPRLYSGDDKREVTPSLFEIEVKVSSDKKWCEITSIDHIGPDTGSVSQDTADKVGQALSK